MPSTFTDALGLEKQATGENSGTWGTVLNDDVIDLIDKAIAVRLALSVAGSSDITLTSTQALNGYHEYTGTLTGNINVIVPASDKVYIIFNNTTGAFTLTVKTSGGTGILVARGDKAILYCNGTNVVEAIRAPAVVETEQATTSGTTKDFTGIAADVKQIDMLLDGVSLSGTDNLAVRLGDAGGFESAAYVGDVATGAAGTAWSTEAVLTNGSGAGDTWYGCISIRLMDQDTFKWHISGYLHNGGTGIVVFGGIKALSAALTQVQLLATGSDTFDLGNVNIIYS